MSDHGSPSAAIVVGVDGSRAAVNAALWAVDEAVERDTPLRLLCAVEATDADHAPQVDETRMLSNGQVALRHAMRAIEATQKAPRIEIEMVRGNPARALAEASRSAVMICVGAAGARSADNGRVGSTATTLASIAHCPVAIIRSHHAERVGGAVVVELDSSPGGDAVLRMGIAEAVLRNASVVAVSTWQPRSDDHTDDRGVCARDRQVRAELERKLAWWKKRYPNVEITTVPVHGSLLQYLSRRAASIHTVVVGRRRRQGLNDIVGPPSYAALHDTDCTVLVCSPDSEL